MISTISPLSPLVNKPVIRRAAIALFWLLVWQGAAWIVDSSIVLAGPWEVLKALAALLPQGRFWQALGISSLRIGGGFLLAFFTAGVLAGLAYVFPLLRELLAPLISLLKTVPVASFVILLLVWASSRYLSTAVSFLVVLPQLYIHLLAGLESVDPRLLELAAVYQIPPFRQFWYLYRPALRGYVTGGCQTALGMCWKSGVAAEVIGVPSGTIGEGFYLAKITLDTAGLLAWTAALLFLSFLFEKGMLALLSYLFPRPEQGQETNARNGSKE